MCIYIYLYSYIYTQVLPHIWETYSGVDGVFVSLKKRSNFSAPVLVDPLRPGGQGASWKALEGTRNLKDLTSRDGFLMVFDDFFK
jgi:hypothetical protein